LGEGEQCQDYERHKEAHENDSQTQAERQDTTDPPTNH